MVLLALGSQTAQTAGVADAEATTIRNDEVAQTANAVQFPRTQRCCRERLLGHSKRTCRRCRMNRCSVGLDTVGERRPPTLAAELAQLLPTGNVARILTTRAETGALVNVLLARSSLAESEFRPLGVTGQEQQETSCTVVYGKAGPVSGLHL